MFTSWVKRRGEVSPRPPHGFPIAILSFDRPDYLDQVLASLAVQVSEADEIILVQDGAYNPLSGKIRGDASRIEECVALFRRMIPWGQVMQSPENLGINQNYERIEQYLFAERKVEAALILEDDLVLSPNYLTVIGQLLSFARDDPRIAYVSAYGDLWGNSRMQAQYASELRPMHENWGAAQTRQSWLAERPLRAAWYELVRGCDYVERNHSAIRSMYASRGWTCRATSQDSVRWLAAVDRGAVRITTALCHARYIGERGVHCTPEHFQNCNFDKTSMFGGAPPELRKPTDEDIGRWLAMETARFTGSGAPFYPGHP